MSSRRPESAAPLFLSGLGVGSRLEDSCFQLYAIARMGLSLTKTDSHLARAGPTGHTYCIACGKACGPSPAHPLSCFRMSNGQRSHAHSHLQNTTSQIIGGSNYIVTGVEKLVGIRPYAQLEGVTRRPKAAAAEAVGGVPDSAGDSDDGGSEELSAMPPATPTASKHKSKTAVPGAEASGVPKPAGKSTSKKKRSKRKKTETIVKGDMELAFPDRPWKGRTHVVVDFTISTMNVLGLGNEAWKTPGGYAAQAEEIKRTAVLSKYEFDNPDRFVPFAGECTGALGASAMGLLKELASRVETPPGEETDPDPKSAKVRAEATGADGAAAARAGLDYFKARTRLPRLCRQGGLVDHPGWLVHCQSVPYPRRQRFEGGLRAPYRPCTTNVM